MQKVFHSGTHFYIGGTLGFMGHSRCYSYMRKKEGEKERETIREQREGCLKHLKKITH